MITKQEEFNKLNEAAPRIPNDINYWTSEYKRKKGKNVMIYTHDDLDGIFSAVAVKIYLESKGFSVDGYGIVSYEDSWNLIKLDPSYINIALDFADINLDVDIYIDHHGVFAEHEKEAYKKQNAIKTATGSAYEGIMDQLGLPVDSLLLSVIDMVDSAKYEDYGVKWSDILEFKLKDILEKGNAKMTFAGAFNQLIKRSDYKTMIEVIYNAKSVSIYHIYSLFVKIFPMNNKERKTGRDVDFVDDGIKRMDTFKKRSRGNRPKMNIKNQKEFYEMFFSTSDNKIKPDGYVILGDLVFFPTGTYANALRARAIIEQDIEDGVLPDDFSPKFILLQYGATLQVCTYGKMLNYKDEELPTLRNGSKMKNLGQYTDDLLKNFQTHLGYKYAKTSSGGHIGIGSVSNVVGECEKRDNVKYIDLFKNKIISDLSGIEWKHLDMRWDNPEEEKKEYAKKPIVINQRVIMKDELKKI